MALVPLQALDAVQDVALVEDQVSVDEAPEVIVVGLALKETVGGGVTAPVVPVRTK